MENDDVHDRAFVMLEGDEDGDVDEASEDAGVDDGEREDVMATEMRGPEEPTHATRKHHELTHIPFQAWCEQCVRGRAPGPPHRGLGGEVREEKVIQTDCCFMKSRPVGVDDSFGRCCSHLRRAQGYKGCAGRESVW